MSENERSQELESTCAVKAARLALSRRGLAISEADLPEVHAAAESLSRVVENEAASLEMSAVVEPFQQVLKSLVLEGPDSGCEPLAAEDLASGRISSEEWVRECVRRIESTPPGRLAWREIDVDEALVRARSLDNERSNGRVRGPLHGMPIGIKAMFDQRGRVSTWGSPLRDGTAPAMEDSTVVARLVEAGAIVLGSQHMAEFALSPTGLNATFGAGCNPWNPDHVSGGSSSGAGMSVGAGHVPLAIGSDTGGSVRLPAALCGVAGLKPTQHRISLAGAMPLSPSLDCAGPVGNTVEACAWAYAAMAGSDPRDLCCLDLPAPSSPWRREPEGPLRLAVPNLHGSPLVAPAVIDACDEARRVLAESGVQCIEVPTPDLPLLGSLASIVLAVESAAMHRQWLAEKKRDYGRQVRRRLSRGFLVPGMDYYDALRLRAPVLRQFLKTCLPGAHALLLPVAPDVAPRVDDTIHGNEAELERGFSRLSMWTRGINYLGVPALSVPAGVGVHGLPLAVQFVGRPLGEAAILTLGRIFQNASNWHLRRIGSRWAR